MNLLCQHYDNTSFKVVGLIFFTVYLKFNLLENISFLPHISKRRMIPIVLSPILETGGPVGMTEEATCCGQQEGFIFYFLLSKNTKMSTRTVITS